MAWFLRGPDREARLIFHSDRGSQYASYEFAKVLQECGITPSMSRKGNCWDNACSETLFGSLKVERLHGQHFETRRQGQDEALDWLHWYNQTRLHSTLKYVSPMQFEQDSALSAGLRKLNARAIKAGYGKAGKQNALSNFPTATTTTKYIQLWDTDSRGKAKDIQLPYPIIAKRRQLWTTRPLRLIAPPCLPPSRTGWGAPRLSVGMDPSARTASKPRICRPQWVPKSTV